MDKKAQIGTLQTIIITLIVIGILLGVGFLLLEEYEEVMEDDYSATVGNETFLAVTEVGVVATENQSSRGCFSVFDVTKCGLANGTWSDNAIDSGNITVTAATGRIAFTAGIADAAIYGFNNSDWNCTYTFNHGGEACEAVEDTVDAISEIPDWLSIIVIIAIVGIILAIVFVALPRIGAGEGTGGVMGAIGESGGPTAEI